MLATYGPFEGCWTIIMAVCWEPTGLIRALDAFSGCAFLGPSKRKNKMQWRSFRHQRSDKLEFAKQIDSWNSQMRSFCASVIVPAQPLQHAYSHTLPFLRRGAAFKSSSSKPSMSSSAAPQLGEHGIHRSGWMIHVAWAIWIFKHFVDWKKSANHVSP